MNFIKGKNRNQMMFSTLEIKIEQDNPVRFVAAIVEHLDLSQLGFVVKKLKTEGRPAFESKLFLKIYLYGYLYGFRSSRRLEMEFIRNMELQCSYNYTNFIELKNVNGKIALIMTVYNIRHCTSILGIAKLINRIKNWTPDYRRILFSFFNTTSLKTLSTMENFGCKLAA